MLIFDDISDGYLNVFDMFERSCIRGDINKTLIINGFAFNNAVIKVKKFIRGIFCAEET
jgi:hypothetical protein